MSVFDRSDGARMKEKLKKILQFIANPRLLICLGLAWMITNGWSYVMFALGTFFKINWMIAVSSAYLAFLWLPISPEKLATVAIAMVLLRLFFPHDEKTLGVLREMHAKLKSAVKSRKKHRSDAKSAHVENETKASAANNRENEK